ncbi:MAG: glycoside hydrolase family 18 protein [Verrucomicrobiota bacterium]
MSFLRSVANRWLFLAAWVLAGAFASAETNSFRIIGYMPHYRVDALERIDCSYLTDMVYFSITPGVDGSLDTKRVRAETVKRIHAKAGRSGVRVWICVGGWSASKGFAPMAATVETRARFVKELAAFCLEHQFAGADIDWEYPQGERETADYNTLLRDLKTAFAPHRLRLSTALPGRGSFLMPDTIALLDAVHVMAYDHGAPHASYEKALKDLEHWREQGVPDQKLIWGLPFYGRNEKRDAIAYAEIVRQHQPKPDADLAGGFHFNGIETIRRKTAHARAQGLGGVMIWELG